MKIIKSEKIKENIINNLKNNNYQKKLLLISQASDKGVIAYKKAIIRRCREFSIDFLDMKFSENENHLDIVKSCKNLDNIGGFIVLQPLASNTDMDYLRENMPFRDLDCFRYDSLGKLMANNFCNLPQTAKSCIRFIDFLDLDLRGKDIVIANSNNVIGRPLFLYLNSKKATVTLFNSKTKNQKEKIKKADIFISAIGRPNYYNKDFFKDGQVLIDVGTSYIDGKAYGDIDYNSISNMDIFLVKSTNGVGSITTLSLLESLIESPKIKKN